MKNNSKTEKYIDFHTQSDRLWEDYKKGRINIKKYISDILRKDGLSISKEAVAEITSRVYDGLYDDVGNIAETVKEKKRKRIREEDIIEYHSKLII